MKTNLFQQAPKQSLIEELFQAYFDCRKNKRNTINALAFEKHFEQNIFKLHDELLAGNYYPGRSIAFIVHNPVKREVFAADFRDRVVHHWLINKTNPLFEQSFIEDSYACRENKGTLYGVNRAAYFIESCSEKYQKDCYILKLDILGFFMHINRIILFKIVDEYLLKHYIFNDQAMLIETCRRIIFNDPTKNCYIKGKKEDWKGLPRSKSLFHSQANCGLPIGNLTSQVFANCYLNVLDHYIKDELKMEFYGRYVDDFIIVHHDKDLLKTLPIEISNFLLSTLQLTLHPKKIYLQHYSRGVKFLGAVIKPNRLYIANRTKGNFYKAIEKQNLLIRDHKPSKEELAHFISSMNSYLGIMIHYKTYNIRRNTIKKHLSVWWWNHVCTANAYAHFQLRKRKLKRGAVVNYFTAKG